MGDLWDGIMQKCLQGAENLLKKETAPTAETAEAVRALVETAIAVNKIGSESPISLGEVIHLGGT